MALMWCEARCDGISDMMNATAEELETTPACHETAPGAFGVPAARKKAHSSGWRVIAEEWICPACQPRRRGMKT